MLQLASENSVQFYSRLPIKTWIYWANSEKWLVELSQLAQRLVNIKINHVGNA